MELIETSSARSMDVPFSTEQCEAECERSSREEMHEIQRHVTWRSAFGRVNIISARHSDVVERTYTLSYIRGHIDCLKKLLETT